MDFRFREQKKKNQRVFVTFLFVTYMTLTFDPNLINEMNIRSYDAPTYLNHYWIRIIRLRCRGRNVIFYTHNWHKNNIIVTITCDWCWCKPLSKMTWACQNSLYLELSYSNRLDCQFHFFLFVLCLLLFVKMNLKIFCHNGKITLEIIQFPLYEHSQAKQKMIGIELGSGSPAGYLVLWLVSIFSSWLRLIINKGLRQSLYIFFWQTQMFLAYLI